MPPPRLHSRSRERRSRSEHRERSRSERRRRSPPRSGSPRDWSPDHDRRFSDHGKGGQKGSFGFGKGASYYSNVMQKGCFGKGQDSCYVQKCEYCTNPMETTFKGRSRTRYVCRICARYLKEQQEESKNWNKFEGGGGGGQGRPGGGDGGHHCGGYDRAPSGWAWHLLPI